jgi:hypothetical protein
MRKELPMAGFRRRWNREPIPQGIRNSILFVTLWAIKTLYFLTSSQFSMGV